RPPSDRQTPLSAEGSTRPHPNAAPPTAARPAAEKIPLDTKKTAPNGRAEKQNSGKLLKEFSAVILFL
ncbi:MAG TPA: hypothetical protein PLY67_03540, partial [Clostridiales bacterium]|nr:hypothetical protein [Clostridiales bacterium]